MKLDVLHRQIRLLLFSYLGKKAHFSFSIKSVIGGKNNRAYIIESSHGRYFAKLYYREKTDLRDRLRTEFDFSRYASSRGITSLPKALAKDELNGLALYEFIDGRKVDQSEITQEYLDQCLKFLVQLNNKRELGLFLPLASDACFNIDDHIQSVERRLKRLLQLTVNSQIDSQALAFLREDFSKIWDTVKTRTYALRSSTLFDSTAQSSRYISPSDFGFHNFIVTPLRQLIFTDFEYAGWDDPAKLICDFFCQPEIPVPHELLHQFTEKLSVGIKYPESLIHRVSSLLPVSQMRWVCILLNEFISSELQRRSFSMENVIASSEAQHHQWKEMQLFRARRLCKMAQASCEYE